ncbi:very short patch repair endonuclease [Nitrosomonas oligotropha]|uniref:very short patch repair endonuclease n=1 Tax=Nitrosomonas oligotropha TaxID=42354 RepID=UPI000D500D49|nr:very short patch repair endonuclease [Nitrosomonas oligotropha]MXS83997.1 DNA mismatch endonuclease Vsr [Nitrosomonas oligotropha]
MDKLTPDRRSKNMRQIRGKNTAPELAVRRLCREIGFSGYRIHRKDLPGKPDLAWIGRKLAIFVHGCFWHGHHCAEGIRKPKSNRDYWIPKIARNQQRDAENIASLRAENWGVVVVWECELSEKERLTKKLQRFLSFQKINLNAEQ